MGYTTEFEGSFSLNKVLDKETHDFLVKLSNTRRMARKVDKKYGVEGEFYVEDNDENVIDSGIPPKTQPGLWCQWTPTEDGKGLEWDDGEKFYEYEAWLVYIINKILEPKGYVVNGKVKWQGEEMKDRGNLIVKNNKVTTKDLE